MSAEQRARIALVTTIDPSAVPFDVDLEPLAGALVDIGFDVHIEAWEDDSVAWTDHELVVVRSPWNYCEMFDGFRRWLDARSDVAEFHNPIAVIEWNIDKRYLEDLESEGVRIVPTRFCADLHSFDDAIDDLDAAEIVVKPTTSAGSRRTGRFDRRSVAARALAELILDHGFEVMVQPHLRSVDHDGEIGTVFIDGERSHSFRKGPILEPDGAFVGGSYREDITAVTVPDDIAELVDRCHRTIERSMHETGRLDPGVHLLFARIDVVRLDDGSPAVLEAELFEPSLFVDVAPGAADRFATACLRRIRGAQR